MYIQHFSPFDIKLNVQLKKKQQPRLEVQLWRVILSSEFLFKNKIPLEMSMSILLHVLLFHLKKKNPLNGWSIFFFIEKRLLLVQLLAIDKIGSTKQTFSHIISFLGSFRWKNWLNQSRNFPSRTVIKFFPSPKMTNSGETDARLSSVDCAIGLWVSSNRPL